MNNLNSDLKAVKYEKMTFMEAVRRYNVVITLIIFIIVATVLTRGLFLTTGNLLNVGERASTVGIVALGQMLVIITGGIDLSVGSIIAVSFVMLGTLSNMGFPIPIVIIMTLMAGMVAGLVNGFLVAKTKVPPFMITLGTNIFFLSLALFLTGARQLNYVRVQDFLNNTFRLTGFGSRLFPTIVWLILSTVIIIVLARTSFGHNIYAIGGKELAAVLSGINAGRVKMLVYSLSGLFCSVAAIIIAYRLRASNPDAGVPLLLESVAAVIVGGTNIMGGEGNVYGTFAGAIIMATMVNLLNLLNADPFIQDAIKGIMLLFFVYLVQVLSKRK